MRKVALQKYSLRPARELNIAARWTSPRKVRWGVCGVRAERTGDQPAGDLPQELQQARRAKNLGLAVSVTVVTVGAAAALAAGMRPPQEALWTLGCGAATVPLGLATAKAALGESREPHVCREHSLHVALSSREWPWRRLLFVVGLICCVALYNAALCLVRMAIASA